MTVVRDFRRVTAVNLPPVRLWRMETKPGVPHDSAGSVLRRFMSRRQILSPTDLHPSPRLPLVLVLVVFAVSILFNLQDFVSALHTVTF